MKILKHGKYYIEDKHLECVCGCEFEYDEYDIITDDNLAFTSIPMQYQQYILCPECRSRINLNKIYSNIKEE